MEKVRYNLKGSSPSNMIMIYKTFGYDFTVKISNYSTTIKVGDKEHIFSQNDFNKKTFIAHQKIKRDLDLFENSLTNEEYERWEKFLNNRARFDNVIDYFNTKEKVFDFHKAKIQNIDIKNAYPTAMLNAGWITKETFKFLNTFKNEIKHHKLAALGMLASTNNTYTYKRGILVENGIVHKTGQYRNVFFELAYIIDRLMTKLKEILEDYFVFYWFDGIYFYDYTPTILVQRVKREIKKAGFEFTEKLLKEFSLERDDEMIRIQYLKPKYEPKDVKEFSSKYFKVFNMPDRLIMKTIQKINEESAIKELNYG